MALLSIIVPVYKVEDYLDQCVESILGQRHSDLELILVDDGSPDRCGSLCDEWAAKDPRVRVIHKENGGVCSARNAGLDAAKGDYVAFVDSDDWLEPEMYTAMMEKVRELDCDVVLCDCVKEHPGAPALYTHDIRPGFYDRAALENEYFPHLLMMENVEYPATISNWLLLFRRELAEGIRYLTGVRYSEDLLFGAQVLYRARSFFYMKDQAFYHYRMNPGSATHRFVPDKWRDYKKLHTGIREAFGSCPDFDFSRQIDLCLLFFLYNAVGDLYGAPLARREKKAMILPILNDPEVREMFRRLNIAKLPISAKQKAITRLYRFRVGVPFLIRYYGG
jgi:glycosyltransferase involved in cell wall biosynthesis